MLERPAIAQGHGARHAGAALGAPRESETHVQGGTFLSLEHAGHGALPAGGRGRGTHLRQHGVADPGVDGDALDGEDLGQALGAGDTHFVVRGVVNDEGTALHRTQLDRRARDAGLHGARRADIGLTVAQQGEEAAQGPEELPVRGPPLGEGEVRRERGVPVSVHAIPVGVIGPCFRPQFDDDELAIGGRELLGRHKNRERDEERDDAVTDGA